MTKVILFLFLFTNICFAKKDCKELGKNIEHLNDLQSKSLNNEDTVKQINIIDNSIKFLASMKDLATKDQLTEVISKYSLENTTEQDLSIFTELSTDCEKVESTKDQKLKQKVFNSCLSNIESLLKNKVQATAKVNNMQRKVEGLKKIIKKSLKDPNVKDLGVVKKSLALEYLKLNCNEEDSKGELSSDMAYNYACRDQVHRPHTEGMEGFAQDNLDVLIKLELENNKVTVDDFKKSCDNLLKNPNLEKELPFCKLDVELGEVGEAIGGVTSDVTGGTVDPLKDEYKAGSDRKVASKKKVKEKVDPNSYRAKRARKRKKTWKTVGIVTAAVGATGLAVWGLTELFKPTPSTLEFTPHPNSLKQYNTQSYDMNTYQQYMMYQNYQSNQSMMYQNNLYQGSTYGYGNNWIGAQDSSASSPYTFEYGF